MKRYTGTTLDGWRTAAVCWQGSERRIPPRRHVMVASAHVGLWMSQQDTRKVLWSERVALVGMAIQWRSAYANGAAWNFIPSTTAYPVKERRSGSKRPHTCVNLGSCGYTSCVVSTSPTFRTTIGHGVPDYPLSRLVHMISFSSRPAPSLASTSVRSASVPTRTFQQGIAEVMGTG